MSRARLAIAVIAAAVAATVVPTAAPSSAGGRAKSTDYPAAWTFSGSVVADLDRNMQLTDYLTSEYYDRSAGTPARSENAVVVDGSTCKISSYFESGLAVYGRETTWANAEVTSITGARMRLACTYGGQVHHLRWGALDGTTPNCLALTRTGGSTWTLSAGETCQARDEIVDKNGNTVGEPTERPLPFTADLVVEGAPPVR